MKDNSHHCSPIKNFYYQPPPNSPGGMGKRAWNSGFAGGMGKRSAPEEEFYQDQGESVISCPDFPDVTIKVVVKPQTPTSI